jgi:hypothetical protein
VRGVCATNVAVKKNMNYIPERVCMRVAVVTQQAKRMRRITLLSVACLAITHFSTLSKKVKLFGKKGFEHETCVLMLSL